MLHGMACVAGVATFIAADTEPSQAAKLPQKAVSYQTTPKGDRQCSGCKLFEAPNACKSVAGNISPKGWCTLWRKA